MGIQNYEQHAHRLVEPDLPMQTRLQLAMEVRDSLEIAHTSEYLNFLKCYFRAFSMILMQMTKPQMTENVEHKLRNVVVDILNRLPHSEVLRPFVQDLLKVSLQVLTQDNEDNAIVAIRIIFDLLRNFRPTFESDLQPFLDFVGTVYSNFPSTVTFFFSNSSMAMEGNAGLARTAGPGSISGDDGNVSLDVSGASVVPYIGAGQLNPSSRSFKIMNECPLIVLFLFQLYAKLMHTNITYLLPRMVAALSIAGPERVPPHLKNQLVDFKGAQIKTLSFLTYLLKSSADSIRPHEENICKSIVNLLVTCPDSVSTRKELLISFKQVLGTEFRRGLFPLIDTLLEERVLVGTGRACTESAKPLAYSLLAEIVHHVRVELSLAQLSRVVYLFSRSLHDSSLNLTIRTTCARLLLNLAEPIFDKGIDQSTMDEARTLLGRVLDAFVSKFRSVKHHIPRLLEGAEAGRDLSVPPKAALEGTTSQSSPPEYVKELNDYKHLVRSLVMGMKTIVWCITNAHVPRTPGMHAQMSNPTSSSPMPQIFKGMREDEVRKASGVLKNGVHCLAVFREKEEERDMVHHFSQILTIMEPRDLMDMFSLCMPHLFDCMCSSSQLLNIFSALLQVPKVLRPFTDVLVNFLVSEKLDTLKQPETPAAKLVLQLFRFIFVAVGKASAECERILQPHVSVIMEVCMKNAMEVDNPLGYLQLLRNMFRALSGGKFDTLLRDLIPLLQPCLNMLLAMLEGPNGDDMKDLILELCLTLPARLSALLPHLPRLHRPLVYALKGNDDLVSLGLRTLEYWVDSLNPDFLEPNMANIMSEVILALWAHLRPPPHPWGAKCLQLLGKLGGRNRRFLKEPLSLECRDNSEHGLRLILTFEPATPFLVPLDRCIHLAVAAVMQKGSSLDPFYRKQTMRFIRICLVPLLNLTLNISGEGVTSGHLEPQLLFSMDPARRRMETPVTKLDLGVKTKMQLFAEKSIFKALLTTIIAASADAELATENDEFLENVCHHFAMVFHVDGPPTNPSNSRARGSVGSNLKDLDPLLFLDALVEVLSGECRLHAKAALQALNMFVETVILLTRCKQSGAISSTSSITVYGQNSVIQTSVFEQLLLRLLHCCYGVSWQSQIGGVMGIGALVNKVPIETICGFLVRIVRGLVYVLKRLPVHANKEQEETSQVLNHVLRVVDNADEAINEFRKQSFQGVVEFLASELFNPNASITVRKNVQSCLSFLANRTGSEVSELLEPLYQPLLQPLIARPLRQKNIEQQVGTVTAMNFCLALRPPLLKLTQEVVSFLQDALQIADADETIWVVKCMNPKVLATFNKLRTACIQLLCTAMMWADFKTPNHADLRARIISMFFKSLTCRTPEIVAVAKEGLRLVIQQQRMPKELLQNSLRPILVNLAHTKSLTMPLLQGLARLLELLSVWFNVTLGVKLLDHLKKWLEPEKLAQSQRSWKAGDEPKVAAAMIELFHLLPPAAIKFLDDLVTITIDLEGALPPGQIYSEINSPYTLPLTKFLNRYATEAVDYFLERLNQPKYFRRFIDIVQSKAGEPLREEVAKSPRKILERAFPEFVQDLGISVENFEGRQGELGSGSVAYFHGLRLICTLVKLMPEWLHQNRIVFDALVFLWKSPERMTRLQNEQGLNLVQVKESKWLIKCFLNYLRHDKSEVGVLFDMMSIFLLRTCIDFEFLKKFYATEVACGYSPSLRKTVLLHFLNLFQSKQLGQDQLVVSMQTLILPMLSDAFQKDMKSEVIDPSILKTIVEKLLDPPEEVSAEYDESLRVELLQLATLLLKYLQNDLVLHRKELIKFGWNHLKREDNSSKQWAFVNVCHFLEAYQAPEKIILQVFIALLRTCQPENRLLVRQALDILMPALPKRLPPGDSRVPIWIRYTKKILVEEGHSIPNLIHIFQLIVRHSELFYSCRAQFVPQMVNSLSRLGLPFTTTTENRRLAIKLAGLVVSWEKQRQTEARILPEREGHGPLSEVYTPGSVSTELKRPPESSSFPDDLSKRVKVEPGLQSLSIMSPGGASFSSTDTPGSTGHADEEYKPNAAMEEMIINFLIRVALVIELKDKESIAMYNNALELLSSALEVWPNANVKFNYLEKILGSFQPSQSRDPAAALAQGLEVMNKALEKQPQLFIRNNINHIAQVLEPCFNSKMLDAGKSLCSLLKMVFGAFPLESPDTPQDVKMLYQRVEDLIQKHLAAVTAPQISLETSTANAVIGFILFMVKSLSEVQNNFVDSFIVPLVRVLQRLMRDMGSSSGSHVRQSQKMEVDSAVNSHPTSDSASVIPNMKSILKLISERVMHSPDSKRSITQILHALLTEKTTDHSVLMSILDAVKLWIEAVPAANPTLTPKETVVYLQKLSQVERQKFSSSMIEEWDRKYLQLLYGVCSDSAKYPSALRHEAFQKVERQYMMGLRAKDPEIRQHFFLLYNDAIEKTLFIRLQFIIQQQDWEAVSDCFWLKQGLDLLLAILVENEPINLAPTSSRIPPLIVPGLFSDHSMLDATERSEGDAVSFQSLVGKHVQFLNEMGKLQVSDLVVPLRDLAHIDANVAYHLWVLVFPIVWVTLQKEEQTQLAKPMIALLSKDYHKKQQSSRPNVVQALIEGLHLSHPQPRMPSDLIKYIGKTYNSWSISLSLLENHVMWFTNDTKCCESLAELYRLLNEDDMRCGLWKKRSITAETRAGLSLVQHGYWQQAQNLFYQAMIKATQGTYNNAVPKAEMCLWEEHWIYCAKQLSQWEPLSDFGKSIENYEILLDCLWKVPDWASLKDVISKAQVEETPKLRLIQSFFALHDRNPNGIPEAENLINRGIELALERWWQLPDMAVQSRIPLLQQFQQLVEVQESSRSLLDISNGNKQSSLSGSPASGPINVSYAELKDILDSWKLRTPNEWDNVSVWYDLLQWRNEIYNVVIDNFKDFASSNPQLHHLGYRDKAWNVNRLARMARRQGLHGVCVNILEKMYGHSTMEVQEAFVKIREQAKAYLEMRGELTSGLNLINSTNLEYFPAKNKAEIFRLKGDFLVKMSDSENANVAYSTAIGLYKNLPKGWASWGNYCDLVYKETGDEVWLEYAVACFLQAIKCGVSNPRSHLARILYLLSFDSPNEPVGRAFDKYMEQVPHWVWLSWIPQLLLSLQRNEASHAKLVLMKIAAVFPQALYYWLRTYLMERRDITNKSDVTRTLAMVQRLQQSSGTSTQAGSSESGPAQEGSGDSEKPSSSEPGGPGSVPDLSSASESIQSALKRINHPPGYMASVTAAFEAAKDIMEALRNKHTNMANELESLLSEIGSRFVTLPEERLLAVVNALVHRCYKYPTATVAEVPLSLKKELSGVCRACFSADAVNKHVDFVREYKKDFESDLDPESPTFPATLSELTERLKHWKSILQCNVEDRFPAALKLEDESKTLRDFHVVDVEIPGQYFTDQDVAADHTIKLDRIGPDVPIVRRHGSSFRRLTLIGSDGSQSHFIVQTSLTPNARSDERILQLFRVLNKMFDKHKESRRRHLSIHAPIIIPVWSQVRMVEDDVTYSTLLEVYDMNCARNNREADLPITRFKEQLNQAITGQIPSDNVIDLRLQAYNEITKTLVPDNIFSQYMYKILSNGNHLWAFKKQFAVQLALSCFVSYMLQIGGRSPNKTLFSRSTGKIFQTDFHPAYDANGMVEFSEPVPFRLTRNMQAFFSQFGVEGPVISAMCAAAQAVVSPKQSDHIWYQLGMFFRDELLQWSWRRPPGSHPAAANTAGTVNTLDFQQKVNFNVDQVVDRVKSIAPISDEEEENPTDPPQSVQRGVSELIDAALMPRNLCMMDPTWHPWF